MTTIGRSNNDVIAEAVAAIGPYKAWIAAKRAEIQAQIAQMQAASAAPSSDNSLAARFRQLGLPQRNGGAASASPDAVLEGSAGGDATMTATADMASAPATAPEGTAETASSAHSGIPEEPVSVPSDPVASADTTPSAALATPQNAKEAQAQLEKVFAATPPQTLPPLVVDAWGQRGRNAVQCTKVLVAAQGAGVLPEALAHAVTSMIALDATFGAVANAHRLGMYQDLVGLFPPTAQAPDEQEDDEEEDDRQEEEEEQDDGDAAEGEGDEQEAETKKQWGFPGEDSRESPF